MKLSRKRQPSTRQKMCTTLTTLAAVLSFCSLVSLVRDNKHIRAAQRTLDNVRKVVVEEPHVYDVLIVGSGWSGLGAADTLRQAGIENFQVLEARDAVGGRSRTVYPFTHDLAVEIGSAWTYEDTSVHDILMENNIPFGEIHYDDFKTLGLYQSGRFDEGEWVTGEIVGEERKRLIDKVWWDGFVEYSENMKDTVLDSGKDVSYQEILDKYIQQSGYADSSKARQFLQAMVHAQIQLEHAAPLAEMSASTAQKLSDCVFCWANYFVPVEGGGFDKVLAHLADPLKEKIRLQHTVTMIEYNDDQLARVTYTDTRDGTKHIKLAERVLVTVSLGVLKAKSIEFVPSLPQWKDDAIEYIGFGVLNKCIFYWEREEVQASSWWPNGKEYMTLVTDQDTTSGVWTTFFNDHEIGNGGEFVLSAWIGGDDALVVEKQTDQNIVKEVLGNLRAMLGEDVPGPTKYVISRWGQDEFARGAYSFDKVGGKNPVRRARKKLADTVGTRLFWAGEATSVDYGMTFGAYESGVEAARKIQASFTQGETRPAT